MTQLSGSRAKLFKMMTCEEREIDLFSIAIIEAVNDFERPDLRSRIIFKDGTKLLSTQWTGEFTAALRREFPRLIMAPLTGGGSHLHWEKSEYEQ